MTDELLKIKINELENVFINMVKLHVNMVKLHAKIEERFQFIERMLGELHQSIEILRDKNINC